MAGTALSSRRMYQGPASRALVAYVLSALVLWTGAHQCVRIMVMLNKPCITQGACGYHLALPVIVTCAFLNSACVRIINGKAALCLYR